jgi:signal transduction histidine kinase
MPLRAVRFAIPSCAILTVLTVLLAFTSTLPRIDAAVRPLYFALLFGFFRNIGAHHRQIRGRALRLIEAGFLVLTLAATATAALMLAPSLLPDALQELRWTFDRGAIYLLGLSLVAYGLILWLPQVLEAHRLLSADYQQTRGELVVAEDARTRMELRMVEADRLGLLGELASGVAHDLRNPLAIIKGTAESLRRKARSADEVAEHGLVITRSVEKADRTIQSLIDLGRPRQGKPTVLRLGDLVREVLELVQVEGRRRKIQFTVSERDDGAAFADRAYLCQALLNLVLNAMQVSNDGRTVAIHCRSFTLRGHSFAAVAVADQGPGLPAAVRAQLFTPFFTTRQGGTGLGLLSCRRILVEMGGRLGLVPRRRGGARAIAVLPAPAGSRTSARGASPAVVAR